MIRVKIFGLIMLVIMGVLGYLFFADKPHMKVMPKIKAYDAQMPLPPAHSVPLEKNPYQLPTTQQAATLKNPLAASAENLARGKTYYGYYCAACHGQAGDGRTPVGESFVPVPKDLRSDNVRKMSDGQLLRAMLTGVGHAPMASAVNPPPQAKDRPQQAVLEYTVLPEHRWYIVMYVRSLGSEK